MKAQKLAKKLILNKQTLARLDQEQLYDVKGGRPPLSYYETEIGCCLSAKISWCC